MGDPVNGKKLFVRLCGTCHTAEKGGKHKLGPNLFGIVGRTSGTTPNFSYTDAMKKKNVLWNEKSLDDYLEHPKKSVPGTKMIFAGLKKPDERKDVIAFLATLK